MQLAHCSPLSNKGTAQLHADLANVAAGCVLLQITQCCSTASNRRYGLSLLNPLLGDAVSLQQGGRVHLTFAPDGMAYPTTSTTVQMQPLRLTVARSPLLRQLLATLSLADRWAPRATALR